MRDQRGCKEGAGPETLASGYVISLVTSRTDGVGRQEAWMGVTGGLDIWKSEEQRDENR